MSTNKGPTVTEAAAEVAATLDGPIAYDDFVQRVLAIRPSSGKHPISQTKSALRHELDRIGLTFADGARKRIAPIRSILNGLTVRHVFDAQEIAERRLLLTDSETILLPGASSHYRIANIERLRLVEADGAEVKTKVDQVSGQVAGPFGHFTMTTPALHMPRWLAQHSVKAGDSALFTILDYDASRWQILYEPAGQRRQPEIEAANRMLADLLFEQLENARDERALLHESLMTVFAQLSLAQRTYPGDSWARVIQLDGRMRHDGYQLTYVEHRSIFETMMADLQAPTPSSPPAPLLPEQESTIYRFKIHSTRNKNIWRRIEILGGQTLRDLNAFLVDEFKHDWDHMGGFWRLVPRGAGKRVREVEIAQVSPFIDEEDDEEDEGAELCVAELDLEPGSQLRWVFDFGDWHQYDLLIEAVEDAPPADAAADFPRVVAQNKPQHLYCTTCQAEGRQSIAAYICLDCSYNLGHTVALCDACLLQHDEDHYTEEIVY